MKHLKPYKLFENNQEIEDIIKDRLVNFSDMNFQIDIFFNKDEKIKENSIVVNLTLDEFDTDEDTKAIEIDEILLDDLKALTSDMKDFGYGDLSMEVSFRKPCDDCNGSGIIKDTWTGSGREYNCGCVEGEKVYTDDESNVKDISIIKDLEINYLHLYYEKTNK